MNVPSGEPQLPSFRGKKDAQDAGVEKKNIYHRQNCKIIIKRGFSVNVGCKNHFWTATLLLPWKHQDELAENREQ